MTQNTTPSPSSAAQPKKGFNPMWLLPIFALLGLAFMVVCAATFAIYGLFFYETKPTAKTGGTPTPTIEVVQFKPDQPDATTFPPTALSTLPVTSVATIAPEATAVQPVAEQPTAAPAPTTASQPVPVINNDPVTMTSPDYSMQVFLFWQAEVADRDLKLVEDAGFRWVKQEFAWREIEGAGKGQYDWSRTDRIMDQIDAHGLKVIVRLGVQPQWATPNLPAPEVGPPDNLQDFTDFVTAVATRYKGRADAYQIWNEPNLAREWGNKAPSASEYTVMLQTAYQAIKAVDPHPIVISAGMAPTTRNDDVARPDVYYIQEMYDAGAKPYFDALGAHGAGFASPPDADPAVVARTPGLANEGDFKPENNVPEELRRVYCFRHVEDLRAIMVKNGDEAKKVVLLEFGWTIDPRPDSPYKWHAISQEKQAEYFVQAYQYAEKNWQPWIGVMSLIYVASPTWTRDDEQTYWSVIYPGFPELNAAPAYYGLKDMEKN